MPPRKSLKRNREEARNIGDYQYISDNPCRRCHNEERYVRDNSCVECNRENTRKWTQKNKEIKRQYDKEYRNKNQAKIREYRKWYHIRNCHKIREKVRQWKKENVTPEEERERLKIWRRNNIEKARERARIWAQRHAESKREYNRKWKRDNADKNLAQVMARYADKLQRIPPWADKGRIVDVYSAARIIKEQTGVDVHVDHIIPLRGKGVSGLHVHTNLQIIPADVNLSKSNIYREEDDWIISNMS